LSGLPHLYQKFELLTKIYNNLTTRSNCFAVWVTVGFFEVNQVDPATGRIWLGQEIGRADSRHVRHRMFAFLDRTQRQTTFGAVTSNTSILAPGTYTITPSAMTGTTASTLTGNTQQWAIQPGMTLRISGIGTAEEVVVKKVNPDPMTGLPISFVADF